MYDVNGNRINATCIGGINQNKGLEQFTGVPKMMNRNSSAATYSLDQIQPGNMHNLSEDNKFLPANERAIQESQLALEREYNKQRKLQEFQRKTKLAAKNYNESVKSEVQSKLEKEKKEAEMKHKKVKEFEEKLKSMRKNMKVKPKDNTTNNNAKNVQNTNKNKKNISVKVQGKANNQNQGHNKENQNNNKKVIDPSKTRKPFGATSV